MLNNIPRRARGTCGTANNSVDGVVVTWSPSMFVAIDGTDEILCRLESGTLVWSFWVCLYFYPNRFIRVSSGQRCLVYITIDVK